MQLCNLFLQFNEDATHWINHNSPYQIYLGYSSGQGSSPETCIVVSCTWTHRHTHTSVSVSVCCRLLTIPCVLHVTHPMNSFWYVLFILTSFGMYSASSLWQWPTGRSGSSSNLTGRFSLNRGLLGSTRPMYMKAVIEGFTIHKQQQCAVCMTLQLRY